MKGYNRSEIMKRAWEIKRADDVSMSAALKVAWAEAKNEVRFENGMEVVAAGVVFTLNRWTKGNHDRVYVNRYDGRKGYGFVDLKTGKVALKTNELCFAKVADLILAMKFQ